MTESPLRSLSASSIKNFEECPAMWEATNHIRIPSESGEAALLGTTCHEALEAFIQTRFHKMDRSVQANALASYFDTFYHKNFPSDRLHADGRRMLMLWLERCDEDYWTNREVLSTEVKESFTLHLGPDKQYAVPFNYIWDRCDKVHDENGTYEVEVIDYKSWRSPMGADAIRGKIQTAAYALAAHKKYPEATRIWVTMDQLRHGPVSVCYTAAEAEAALQRIIIVGNQIIERLEGRDEFEEIPGPGCRYCVRKMVCDTVAMVEDVKPLIRSEDVDAVARAFYRLQHAVKAQTDALAELGTWLEREAERRDVSTIETDTYNVNFKLSNRRAITDPHRLARIVGSDIMEREGTLSIGVIDKLLKGNELNDRQKAEIKSLIQKNWSPNPSIEVVPIIG